MKYVMYMITLCRVYVSYTWQQPSLYSVPCNIRVSYTELLFQSLPHICFQWLSTLFSLYVHCVQYLVAICTMLAIRVRIWFQLQTTYFMWHLAHQLSVHVAVSIYAPILGVIAGSTLASQTPSCYSDWDTSVIPQLVCRYWYHWDSGCGSENWHHLLIQSLVSKGSTHQINYLSDHSKQEVIFILKLQRVSEKPSSTTDHKK